MGSPTGIRSLEVNSTPEELMFWVSPEVLTLAPELTTWSGKRKLKR
jgi:hypothetical protein